MLPADKGWFFFKVFDLSFFAPGVVIALTTAWVWKGELEHLKVQLSTAAGIITVVVVIGGIYSIGLTIFSLMWSIYRLKRRDGPFRKDPATGDQEEKKLDWPPFPLMFPEEICNELILYFWYLRATCFGLACSFIISALILCFVFCIRQLLNMEPGATILTMSVVIICEILASFMLILQGKRLSDNVDQSLNQRALDYYS